MACKRTLKLAGMVLYCTLAAPLTLASDDLRDRTDALESEIEALSLKRVRSPMPCLSHSWRLLNCR